MKIINTLKNFIDNNIVKFNFSKSSSDNILLKEKIEILDLKLKELENLAQGSINLLKNRHFIVDTSQNNYFGSSEFDLSITDNIVIMCGRLASKQQLNGEYNIDLPINIRPKNSYVGYWTNVIVDGVAYRFHIQVSKSNPKKLTIFSYDNFPAKSSIVFQIVFPLDDTAY